MKFLYSILVAISFLSCNQSTIKNVSNHHSKNMEQTKSIYDFSVTDIDGNHFDLSSLKGKKVMIVNTASECGLTPQFEQLQKLYEEYKSRNFVIIGFPSNDFMGQDPGSDEEIARFCQKNYGVTFPMMSKIKVKGKDQEPLYKYLTTKEENGIDNFDIAWNFQKFLINTEGKIDMVIGPRVLPTDQEIKNWIKAD